jgi:hypothetical protein
MLTYELPITCRAILISACYQARRKNDHGVAPASLFVAVIVYNGRDPAIRINPKIPVLLLLAFLQIEGVQIIGQRQLFESDGDLVAVGRRPAWKSIMKGFSDGLTGEGKLRKTAPKDHKYANLDSKNAEP